jgi:hypothetical protein
MPGTAGGHRIGYRVVAAGPDRLSSVIHCLTQSPLMHGRILSRENILLYSSSPSE